MTDNLEYWNALRQPPAHALKKITGGRLKDKTDISPQWRLQAMTEQFGPVGIGWKYEIKRVWAEDGADGEKFAFAEVNLFINRERGSVELQKTFKPEWSDQIPGIGGSMLIQKERGGLYNNDEAYKMAITDALSVAMKALGVAGDIYMGLWDGSKYKTPVAAPDASKSESSKTIAQADWDSLSVDAQTWLQDIVNSVRTVLGTKGAEAAVDTFEEQGLEPTHKAAAWSRFDKEEKKSMKSVYEARKKTDGGENAKAKE